jgi:hypothetical protein
VLLDSAQRLVMMRIDVRLPFRPPLKSRTDMIGINVIQHTLTAARSMPSAITHPFKSELGRPRPSRGTAPLSARLRP